MEFRTKGDLLEHLGKDRKDVRLIDRMIARGEVVKEDGVYRLVSPAGNNKELMERIESLEFALELKEGQVESLKNDIEELNELKKTSGGDEYEELKVNYEYLQQKFRRLKRGYELVIELTYKYAAKNMKISKEEYKEQLSDEINEALSEEMGRDE